jgi:hypothetical protein
MAGQNGRREKEKSKGIQRSLWSVCFFSLALFFMGLPLSAVAAKYGGGAGTPDAPFLISTTADFQAIGNSPADWDKRFKLTQSIDLSDCNEVNLHMIGHWVALGSTANQPFTGEFDGNGKTISNFTYKDMTDDYVGLFQHVTGVIRNLKLVRAMVVGSKFGVGALVGNLDTGSVLNCWATEVNVSGNNRVGGLVGSASGIVSTSYSSGSVSGVLYVGGLIGQVGSGSIAFSYSRVQVVGTENVGGLIGVTLNQDGVVNSCYATGDVKGTTYVAGLVGQVSAGRVYRCFSAGKVSGSQYVGGLVGYQRALADVVASVWDTQTSKQTKSVGGTGKTTTEMHSADTFLALNWDFSNVWTICDGLHYPVLLWQIPPGDLCCPDGVNFEDFVWFAANWRHRDCGAANLDCGGADLDKSGSVDLRDLAIFAENWLAGIE